MGKSAAGIATLLTCGAVALSAPVPASAAVTIGGDISPPTQSVPCDSTNTCDGIQLTLGGVPPTAPFDGVVVRWRVNDATGPLTLRVVRPNGSAFTFMSSSQTVTATGAGVETFPTQLPIQAGDYVAFTVTPSSRIGLSPASTGDTTGAFDPSTPDGGTASLSQPPEPKSVFAYNADVEPDADHDGFGDETQDQCPTNAATHGPCPPPPPPPDTTPPALSAAAHAAKLSRAGAISFFVNSNENSAGTASGTISVPKLAKVVRFAQRRVTLTAGKRTKVTLNLSKKSAALVRKALARHKKLKAKVTLRVKDTAGNQSVKKLSLKLLR
jgi:hypothetical protein